MQKYLIIDVPNMFHRVKHVIKGLPEEIIGMTLHTMFMSIGKVARTNPNSHVVFCFDGSSWRKSIYAPYKRNRIDKIGSQTPQEQELSILFFDALKVFQEFVTNKTNCTVLYNPNLEADDLIAGIIQCHPDDEHIIISGDRDFQQLISASPMVSLYDGVQDQTTTINGVYDYLGKPIKDKKTGLPRTPPNPEWALFEKAVRGCTTDNIFSAYPGVREKGSKNKIGMREAFEDRVKQGFAWNSFMMSRWTDHEGVEHKVLDDYNRNVVLVDLNAQPDNIREIIFETIADACVPKNVSTVGLHLLKLCGKYELNKISERVSEFSELLNKKYNG